MAKKNNPKNDDIQINLRADQDSGFSRKTVPDDRELGEFEEHMEDEARDEEIDEGLTEIYQDEEGHLVDVHKLEKIKRKGFLLSLVNALFFLLIVGGAGYYVYDNFLRNTSFDTEAIKLEVEAYPELVAGEEFVYELVYKNESRLGIRDVRLNVNLPDNFILKEANPPAEENHKIWEIGEVAAASEGKIEIKGYLMGSKDDTGILSAYLTYMPEGLNTEYKRDTFLTSKIIDVGVDFDFDYYDTALVGETEEILLRYIANDRNYIDGFRVTMEPQENISNIDYEPENSDELGEGEYAVFQIDRPGVYEVEGVSEEELVLPIRFVADDKVADEQALTFIFDRKADDGQYYEFYREVLNIDIMKNNLNLAMIINGERDDMGVDFGEKLNYSIIYTNKGDSDIRDVAIMAVLDGDHLDWTTLDDKNLGREKGNTITWTKEEIPDLALIKQDEEGVIDFSIDILEFGAIDLDKRHKIESYARFSLGEGNSQEVVDDEESDNKSNTIIAKLNSDLKFSEELRYFNEDNIPVGSGPNPPKVGEETSYKVYWTIENNLHELSKLGVTLKLPEYVEYDIKERATVGSIVYSEETHEVVWNIGRLPTSVYQASAEFNVKINPNEDDRNKIMVILPGSNVQAVDIETEEELSLTSKAKTTKLEDDEIGRGDGIVE